MNRLNWMMGCAALALAAAGCSGVRTTEPLVKTPMKVEEFKEGRWLLDTNIKPTDSKSEQERRDAGAGRYVLDLRYDGKTREYQVDAGEALGRFQLVAEPIPGVRNQASEGPGCYGSLTFNRATLDRVCDSLTPVEWSFFRPLYANIKIVPTNGAYAVLLMRMGSPRPVSQTAPRPREAVAQSTYSNLPGDDLRAAAAIGIDPESVGGIKALLEDPAARASKDARPLFVLYGYLSPTNDAGATGPVSAKENADLLKLRTDLAKEHAKGHSR